LFVQTDHSTFWATCFLQNGKWPSLFCDLSVDGIGTCWPRSTAGNLISRPCPEQFNGIHYNTTSKYHTNPEKPSKTKM
uniref:G-protein coupled receptors family 2 profile 1 domain-containing protein n=1 Tax=Nothobranchius furzeri TaxID=105023 RepID=A0A8C6MG07_NOTFU